MTNHPDPRATLEHNPMSRFQVLAVGICVALTALDGFDVLAISFASPGIASEWAINRAELGVVLAMELVGMALGSITLGGLADRAGRRPTILICLVLMTAGMYAASLAQSVGQLLAVRFLTGLGIGGMLAATNAMAAEYSNAKRRHLAVILMATGYPIGATLGGSVSSYLLTYADWRAVFEFGAVCTGFFLFVVWVWLPESIEHLCRNPSPASLDKVNQILNRMRFPPVSSIAAAENSTAPSQYKALLSGRFRSLTVLLGIAYFFHIMTFYYILKWIPKIVVDMGYAPAAAGAVLVWANVGGGLGALLLGILSSRFDLRRLMMAVLVVAFVMVGIFGLGQSSLMGLSVVSAATGFFTNAGVVGFYALLATSFPAELRASGTGLVIGVGRGGAALGPVIAGFLFTAGFGLPTTSVVMGLGALLAAVALYFLKRTLLQPSSRAAV